MMSNPDDNSALQMLETIVGAHMSSVEFVMDYVQLRFDGSTLTAVTTPSIIVGNQWLHWEETGYRDALCHQISHTVKSVHIEIGVAIAILFENGVEIQISLRECDYEAAEAVIFYDASGGLWVL